jgi:GNAT superfamily N-acetyltransferase
MTEVRPIRAEDRTDWRRLWRDYLAFYQTSLPEEVYATSFSRLVDPEIGDYRGLLAVRDGRPIGLAHVIFHRHGWQIAPVTYLQDLYVAPEARGSGVARLLMASVYALADASGAPGVYWLTQQSNETARRLYDRVGRVTRFIKYVR